MQDGYDPLLDNCRVGGCEWTYGKYGIKKTGKKGIYSVWWMERGVHSRQRRTLETTVAEVAKRKVIAKAHGYHQDHPGGDPPIAAVLAEYLATLPEIHQQRRVGRMLLPTIEKLASTSRVSDLTVEFQTELMKDLSGRYNSKSIAVVMALLSKATTWATTPRQGVRLCRPLQQKIICNEERICELAGIAQAEPDNWAPDRDGMVRLILALQGKPKVLRWLLIMLTFGCRVEAAAEATGQQLRWSQFRINPEGRRQIKNKFRPELPVAPSALREMRTWGDGPWVGMSAERIGDVIREVRVGLDMPELKPSSIRDYVATMLRHAHSRHGVRFIHKEERKTWMGHKKQDISDDYGEFAPDFMIRTLVATEAVLRDLNTRSGGGLFRQGSDETPLDALSAQEDSEIRRLLEVNDHAEVHRDARVFLGPKRVETGDFGPVQGSFRQVSDKKVRRKDGVIDICAALSQPSLQDRLERNGIAVLEEVGAADESVLGKAVYLVAGGANVIPGGRASALASPQLEAQVELPVDAAEEADFVAEFRRLEAEVTREFDGLKAEGAPTYAEERFRRRAKQAFVFAHRTSGHGLDGQASDDEVDRRYGQLIDDRRKACRPTGFDPTSR